MPLTQSMSDMSVHEILSLPRLILSAILRNSFGCWAKDNLQQKKKKTSKYVLCWKRNLLKVSLSSKTSFQTLSSYFFFAAKPLLFLSTQCFRLNLKFIFLQSIKYLLHPLQCLEYIEYQKER